MSRSKTVDQVKGVRSGFVNTNHTFFKRVADAIAAKIKKDTGLDVKLVGKESDKTGMSATLIGNSADPELNGDIEERVRKVMQSLKNPANLTDLLR